MSSYALHIGPKTRFLNLFRRAFKVPFLENFLAQQIGRSSWKFWQKLVPPDYLYQKGSLRQVNINGIRYVLDIHNVVEHLVYFRIAPENFGPVEPVLKNARVLFDIGANIGSTALYFASKNPQARIYSFEPHPDTWQKARNNIDLNSFGNIHLVNKGLGDTDMSTKLYQVVNNNPGMNRILPDNDAFPFVMINITTLDGFCLQHGISKIDFMKVDVEGFEYHVLKGGCEIISSCHPVIYLELYDHGLKKNGHSAGALVALARSMGYNRFTNAYTMKPVDETTDFTDCDFDIIMEKK
jgi:FkbM family methyltransferase